MADAEAKCDLESAIRQHDGLTILNLEAMVESAEKRERFYVCPGLKKQYAVTDGTERWGPEFKFWENASEFARQLNSAWKMPQFIKLVHAPEEEE